MRWKTGHDGRRLTSLVSPRLRDVAAGLTLLGPHIPLLFQGEEWGARTPFFYFTDHGDAERSERVRARRREQLGLLGAENDVPDPDDEATFIASKLDWTERETDGKVLGWYRELIALRRMTLDLAGARFSTTECAFDTHCRRLAIRMNQTLVVANLSPSEVSLTLDSTITPELLATSSAGSRIDGNFLLVDSEGLVVLAGDRIAVRDPSACHQEWVRPSSWYGV